MVPYRLDQFGEPPMMSVAPLRYGAGMKGKVTQSLAAGVPVVTTSVGAEGLQAQSGRDLMVADDDAGFVSAVAELHRDPELWDTLSENGRALVVGAGRRQRVRHSFLSRRESRAETRRAAQ